MPLSVNVLTNANVYVDGVGLMGRAAEVTIAKPKHKMIDHQGLGMAGGAEFWAGVDKLESKIKWASVYPEVEQMIASPFTAHAFQVRGDIRQESSQGILAEVPLVYLMTGVVKDAGELVFKLHDAVDTTSTIAVRHAEMYIGGQQMFLFDVMANIYIVNGVDQLAQFRANLGG